ncbi:MAG: nickel-responsive transcriptional regulator NikR [Caldisericia bacterium]|jgi:CopG family nickel-responsive transcriptional regulator|nr:nickel-responsive transcriptional regulator NikR [Caldisericia bacterium]
MGELVRFGVSLEKNLLKRFDNFIKEENYPTRSKAISDLISETLTKREWIKSETVFGSITLFYNHHKRDLSNKLVDLQHDFNDIIISNLHVHIDKDNCLEVIAFKGNSKRVYELNKTLKSIKNLKFNTSIIKIEEV